MNCLSRKMDIAEKIAGRISASRLLINLSLLMMMNRGMDNTWPGIISTARNIINSTVRPGKRILEKANAAMEEAASCNAVADRDTISEFLINMKKSTFAKTSR